VTTIFAASGSAILVAMLAVWIVSVFVRNASIVDLFWGPGFAIVAWTAYAFSPVRSMRGWVVCMLATIWATRLATHLAVRNIGHGEDYRYRAMRERYGARFPLASLFLVFLLQGVLMWIVSWPLQAVHGPAATAPMGVLDGIGVGLWLVGLLIEAVADAQLARFKQSASPGEVMDGGLWRYSRHPNYFGDFVVWWGFGVLAAAAGAWWALVGPAVMSMLLIKVSGVALLESTIAERRPAYRAYIARTSAFVPWPPR
jgi:steroid 5-alpha reductase family enzyme